MAAVDGLKQQIKEMIVERLFLKIEPSEINDDGNLMEDHPIDSISLLEIVVGLEEVFGLAMEEADFDLETFSTVSRIAEFTAEKLGGGEAGEPAA